MSESPKPSLLASVRSRIASARSRFTSVWAHRRLAGVALIGMVALWVLRPLWQPYAVLVRVHLVEVIAYAVVLVVALRILARRAWIGFAIFAPILVAWLILLYGANVSPYDYVSLWWRYRHVEKQERDTLPETGHERVQPLHSVRTLSNEVLSDTQFAAEPDIVRVDGEYRITFAIEPPEGSYWRRAWDPIRTVVSLPVTDTSFDFSKRSHHDVYFPTGEGLALSSNLLTAAERSFGPVRFCGYVPNDVKYMKDDSGRWVQVVSLLRWRGVLMPWPEFGGVLVFHQGSGGIGSWASRALFGSGEWIRPEDVPKHPFLVGQNLVPTEVSRYIAESFRFRAGIWAPFPLTHRGDIRVPLLPEDRNPQPYTLYAAWDGEPGKLWHYFGLEPYDPTKGGLVVSLFVPADGIGPVRVVSHADQGLVGVSTIPAKVRESDKDITWIGKAVVEHRPFIRTVGGQQRLYWLSTVVTYKKGDDGDFIAGATPSVTLTAASRPQPVWVNANDRSSWVPQLERELLRDTGAAAAPIVGTK